MSSSKAVTVNVVSAIICLTSVALTAFRLGDTRVEPARLQVRQIDVVDLRGQVVATLGCDPDGLRPSFRLFDVEGVEVFEVAAESGPDAVVSMSMGYRSDLSLGVTSSNAFIELGSHNLTGMAMRLASGDSIGTPSIHGVRAVMKGGTDSASVEVRESPDDFIVEFQDPHGGTVRGSLRDIIRR